MFRSTLVFIACLLFSLGATAQNGPPDHANNGGNSGNAGNSGNNQGNQGQNGNQGNGPPASAGNRGVGNPHDGLFPGSAFNPDFVPPGLTRSPRAGGGPGRASAPGQCSAGGFDAIAPGQSGRSHTAHTNFAGVDPETGDLLEGEDDPWARMTYFWVGSRFDFVFNAHNLEPESGPYTLVAEASMETDEGPQPTYLCMASGSANDEGDLHLADSVELETHLGYDPEVADEEQQGVLFILLDSADVDCQTGELSGSASGDYLYSILNILFVNTTLSDDEG